MERISQSASHLTPSPAHNRSMALEEEREVMFHFQWFVSRRGEKKRRMREEGDEMREGR